MELQSKIIFNFHAVFFVIFCLPATKHHFFHAQIWCICLTPFTFNPSVYPISFFPLFSGIHKNSLLLTTKIISRVQFCKLRSKILHLSAFRKPLINCTTFPFHIWSPSLFAIRQDLFMISIHALIFEAKTSRLIFTDVNERKLSEMEISFFFSLLPSSSQEWVKCTLFHFSLKEEIFISIIIFFQLNICIDTDFFMH